MDRQKIVVFATGGEWPNEGWSGFKELAHQQKIWALQADIVAVVSSHKDGWVAHKATEAWVPFIHMEKPFSEEKYAKIVQDTQADIIALSWRTSPVTWIDPIKCIDIYPGPLGKYKGEWIHGDSVHEKIYEDLKAENIRRTCVTMYVATDPLGLIFQYPVELEDNEEIMNLIDDKDVCISAIKRAVNKVEHERQRKIINMVANGEIKVTQDDEKQKLQRVFPRDYHHDFPISLEEESPYDDF